MGRVASPTLIFCEKDYSIILNKEDVNTLFIDRPMMSHVSSLLGEPNLIDIVSTSTSEACLTLRRAVEAIGRNLQDNVKELNPHYHSQ